MGGLTREEVKKVNDSVPILSKIPLIGKLFQSKSESTQKKNLMIFVTANLINAGGAPKKQSLRNVQAGGTFKSPSVVMPSGNEPRAHP